MPALRLLKRVKIDVDALEQAFEGSEPDGTWYLDAATGEVRFVPEDDVPPRLLAQIGERYLPVPHDDPSDVWNDMAEFVPQVQDAKLRRRLRDALKAQSVRRFRMALFDAEVLDEWSVWQASRVRSRMIEWLASIGIAAVFDD
jgi:hypothetical protein